MDAVTQMRAVGETATISEAGLAPVLEAQPDSVPGFHSDNGSEFVSKRVAALPDRRNAQFTKSRPRHGNEHALAESRNASMLRRHPGHGRIPQGFAPDLDRFPRECFVPHLSFHLPGGLAGAPPPPRPATGFLKAGIDFEQLDRQVVAITDPSRARGGRGPGSWSATLLGCLRIGFFSPSA